MKFKGIELKQSTLENRLRLFLKESNQKEVINGKFWYKNMSDWIEPIAVNYNVPMYKACGIFAALSPQMSVPRNKDLFLTFLKTGNAAHYKMLIDKCNEILTAKNWHEVAKILNGKKITAFYMNIYMFDRATKVTIDRHAISSLLQTPKNTRPLRANEQTMTANQYAYFESIYKSIADEMGILPHQLQAIVWDTYRRLRDLQEFEFVPF